MKRRLKELHFEQFGVISNRIEACRTELNQVQAILSQERMSVTLLEQEKEITQNLKKWNKVDESVMRQKAKIRWLKEGDVKSSFFHASLKARMVSNRISRLTNSKGEMLTSEQQIEDEVSRFY